MVCCSQVKVADAEGKDVSFRKLLLGRVQREFEKEKEDEQAVLEKSIQLKGLSRVRMNSCITHVLSLTYIQRRGRICSQVYSTSD